MQLPFPLLIACLISRFVLRTRYSCVDRSENNVRTVVARRNTNRGLCTTGEPLVMDSPIRLARACGGTVAGALVGVARAFLGSTPVLLGEK